MGVNEGTRETFYGRKQLERYDKGQRGVSGEDEGLARAVRKEEKTNVKDSSFPFTSVVFLRTKGNDDDLNTSGRGGNKK